MGEAQQAVSRLGTTTWLLAAGFGLHCAWVASVFHHGVLFDAANNMGAYYGCYLASMAVLVLTLVCFGLRGGSAGATRLFASRPVALAFAGSSLAGSALSCLGGFDTGLRVALFAAGAVLTGVGSAYINVLWGLAFVRRRETQPVYVLCLAYVLSSALYYVIARLPQALVVCAVALLPLASVLMALRFGGTGEAAGAPAAAPADDEVPAGDVRVFSRRLLVAAALFGGVLGVIRELASTETLGEAADNSALFLLFSGALLVIMIVYLRAEGLQSSFAERFAVVYRISLLVMVGALLVCSVVGVGSPALQVLLLSGYTLFKVLVWAEMCRIGRTGGVPAVRVFAWGEGAMTAGLLVLSALLYPAAALAGNQEQVVRAAIAAGIALLLVAYLFILTERHIIAIEETDKVPEGEVPHFRFQSRMDDLASGFGLTKREAEVLRLFVRGRSTARIAEDLYVSSGTVATHLRNIYRKAGVHSRQELLDLLDAERGQAEQGQAEQGQASARTPSQSPEPV